MDGICNAIVKAEQHTVIKAEVSTAELEKINQWSAAHIKAEEEIWTRQSKKLVRCLSKNEGIWLSSRWLIFMIIVQAVSYSGQYSAIPNAICANARSPRHCRRLLFYSFISLFNNRRYNCYTSVIFRFGRNFSRPTVYCFFNVGNAPVSSKRNSAPAHCKAVFICVTAVCQSPSVTCVVPPLPTISLPMPFSSATVPFQ